MNGTTSTSTRSMTASPLQMAAAAVVAVFLLVGVAGFVPGLVLARTTGQRVAS